MKKGKSLSIDNLDDSEIVEGLRNKDERITRQYFYEYCRMAYCIYSKRYYLAMHPGMDFFSIAHEYYLALDRNGWRQLDDRKPGMSLRTWMINGFRFVVLDRLKAAAREFRDESLEERRAGRSITFDIPDADFKTEVRTMVEQLCDRMLGRDTTSSVILKMILVEGFKGKEVAAQLGISPSAVTQRYRRLMADLVTPYFKQNYDSPVSYDCCEGAEPEEALSSVCCCVDAPASASFGELYAEDTTVVGRPWRVTPEYVDTLAANEIFVFGSNPDGMHGGGAARTARLRFGAVMGQGSGLQGRSYAIPTICGGLETLQRHVDEFLRFASCHPELHFLVTRIGCGLAGFDAEDIAPLFAEALDAENISLPMDFLKKLR